MTPHAVVANGDHFCWDIPTDGAVYEAKGTFAFISRQALQTLEATGSFVYDGITWRMTDQTDTAIHVRADIDRTEMWIKRDDRLPLVLKIQHNPLGIDWMIEE